MRRWGWIVGVEAAVLGLCLAVFWGWDPFYAWVSTGGSFGPPEKVRLVLGGLTAFGAFVAVIVNPSSE